MSAKSELIWMDAKSWCLQHPGQTMAIVTPNGSFSLSWEPKPTELKGVSREFVARESESK